MAKTDRWLLPEGIDEVLPPEAQRLETLRRQLLDFYRGWGYELVIPPFIEFVDSLLTGTGNDLDLQTFKLTDQLSGKLMGVRADITPQVARIDAHQLKRDVPTRLCYIGTVLHTRPDGFAGSRSPLQVGLELYGHSGIDSDVEVLQLMVETLALTGVSPVHIDLGHVGIYRALAREAGLDGAQEAELFDALQRKARPEIEDMQRRGLLGDLPGTMLCDLVELNGGAEVLDQARRRLASAGSEVQAALDDLERLATVLAERRPEITLHYDLAELRGYHYHTGVVFAAFVPGHGQAIAQGGRYDDIGRVFGRARPATGFSTDLKTLVALAPGSAAPAVGGIFAPCSEDAALRARVAELRAQGERVVCALPGQSGGAEQMGCDRALVERDGRWEVVGGEAAH
ncbi:MAG TPA: ATP phosphoribosyltransferase regulatory subunit [Gammaproteobacteria bacterium]|nr:ATP phosphoribosyltransferase regulatory subunit [Gammaproteobacteria bacterium]